MGIANGLSNLDSIAGNGNGIGYQTLLTNMILGTMSCIVFKAIMWFNYLSQHSVPWCIMRAILAHTQCAIHSPLHTYIHRVLISRRNSGNANGNINGRSNTHSIAGNDNGLQ